MLKCRIPTAKEIVPEPDKATPEDLLNLQRNQLYLRIHSRLLRKAVDLALESSSEEDFEKNYYRAEGAKLMLKEIEAEIKTVMKEDQDGTSQSS